MAQPTQPAQWQWQEEGTSWKGIGIYHVTLTVPSREPLLGKLVIPDNNPAEARVEQTPTATLPPSSPRFLSSALCRADCVALNAMAEEILAAMA